MVLESWVVDQRGSFRYYREAQRLHFRILAEEKMNHLFNWAKGDRLIAKVWRFDSLLIRKSLIDVWWKMLHWCLDLVEKVELMFIFEWRLIIDVMIVNVCLIFVCKSFKSSKILVDFCIEAIDLSQSGEVWFRWKLWLIFNRNSLRMLIYVCLQKSDGKS
jgi:hypothetical protein